MPLLETIKGIFGGRIFTKDASESEAEQLKRLQRLLDQAKRNGDADEVKEIQAEIDALLNQKESKDEGIIEEGLNKALSFAGLDSKGVKDSGCTRDGSRPSDSVIAKWLAQAPANLKSHPQWSESDYAYFREKGWSDSQIKQKWDTEIGDGKGPVNWKKNPWNDKKSKDAVYNKFQGKYTGQAGYTEEEWYECQEIEQDLRWNSDRYGYDSPQAKAARRRLDGLTVGGYKDADIAFTAEEAQEIAAKAGVDLGKYDLKEFCNGLSVELEHFDLTAGDPSMTAKIVIAHLNEIPDYYTRLAKMEASAKTKDASNFPVKEIYKGYAIKGPINSTQGIIYQVITHEGEGWAETSKTSVQEAKSWIDQHKHPFSYVGTQHSEPWAKDSKTKDRKAVKDTAFSKGDRITANISVQGMVEGKKYKVIELDHGKWGTVGYKIKGPDGDEFWVVNLHVLATKDVSDAETKSKYPPFQISKLGADKFIQETYGDFQKIEERDQVLYKVKGRVVAEHCMHSGILYTRDASKDKKAVFKDRFRKLMKDGGVGSGVKGHITPKQIEAMKKRNKAKKSPYAQQFEKKEARVNKAIEKLWGRKKTKDGYSLMGHEIQMVQNIAAKILKRRLTDDELRRLEDVLQKGKSVFNQIGRVERFIYGVRDSQ